MADQANINKGAPRIRAHDNLASAADRVRGNRFTADMIVQHAALRAALRGIKAVLHAAAEYEGADEQGELLIDAATDLCRHALAEDARMDRACQAERADQ